MASRRRVLAAVGSLLGSLTGCVARRDEVTLTRSPTATPTPTPTPRPPGPRRLVPVRTPIGSPSTGVAVRPTDGGDRLTIDRTGEVPNSCFTLAASTERRGRDLVVTESFERDAGTDVSCPDSVAVAGYTVTVPFPREVDRVVVSHPFGARYVFRVERVEPDSSGG